MNERENILKPIQKEDVGISINRNLVLHNDNNNSFDYVISCLVEVCKHDFIQAEQCAYITHYKGKCDIKKGEYQSLKNMKDVLVDRGLIVSID